MKVKFSTILRTVLLFIALGCQLLISFLCVSFIKISSIIMISSTVFTVIVSLWCWWQNNSFTLNALIADDYYQLISGNDSEATLFLDDNADDRDFIDINCNEVNIDESPLTESDNALDVTL